jgi:hypothetical protein
VANLGNSTLSLDSELPNRLQLRAVRQKPMPSVLLGVVRKKESIFLPRANIQIESSEVEIDRTAQNPGQSASQKAFYLVSDNQRWVQLQRSDVAKGNV